MRLLASLLIVCALAACGGGGGGAPAEPGCVNELNCGGETPHCVDGACVACIDDAHCAGELVCSVGTCVPTAAFTIQSGATLGANGWLVAFDAVGFGASQEITLAIQNTGGTPLSIAAALEGEAFAIASSTLELPAQTTGAITVRFAPRAEGSAEGMLVLSADGTDAFEVKLTGVGVKPALICPASIEFDAIPVGSTAARTIVCNNPTPVVLPVSLEAGGAFSVVSATALQAIPRDDFEVRVAFTPTATQESFGTLQLVGADGVPAAEVSLRGFGIATALALEPAGPIDFLNCAPGERVTRALTLRNLRSNAIAVSAEVVQGDGAFSVEGQSAFTLDAGGQSELVVAFAPEREGQATALLQLTADGHTIDVPLAGLGGGPLLACGPRSVDMGQVAIGTPATAVIHCANVGPDVQATLGDNLRIEGFSSDVPGWSAAVRGGVPADGFEPGAEFLVEVTFAPTAAGATSGAVTFVSKITSGDVAVAGQGKGRSLPPCVLEIVPGALDFGVVTPPYAPILDVTLRNRSAHDCLIHGMEIVSDTEPSGAPIFSFGGAATPVIPAFGSHDVLIGFYTFGIEGSFSGTLAFQVSDPVQPKRSVALSGVARAGCLRPVEPDTFFGSFAPGCAAPEQRVGYTNTCSTPIEVTGVALRESTGPFALGALPELPLSLAPGGRFDVPVGFTPTAPKNSKAAVHVYTSEAAEPVLAVVSGDGHADGERTDVFNVEAGQSLFVLFGTPVDPMNLEVHRDGRRVPRMDGSTIVWGWNATANAVEFFSQLPAEGSQLEITYAAVCN